MPMMLFFKARSLLCSVPFHVLLGVAYFVLQASLMGVATADTIQTLRLIDTPDATQILIDTPQVRPYTILKQTSTQTDILIEQLHPSKTLQVDVALTQRIAKIQAKKLPNGALKLHLEGTHLPSRTLVGFVPPVSQVLSQQVGESHADVNSPQEAPLSPSQAMPSQAQSATMPNHETAQALVGVSEAPTKLTSVAETPLGTSALQKVPTNTSPATRETPSEPMAGFLTMLNQPEWMGLLPPMLALLGIGLLGWAGLWWMKRQGIGGGSSQKDALAVLQQMNQSYDPSTQEHPFAQAMAEQGWEPETLLHQRHDEAPYDTVPSLQAHYAHEAYRQEVTPAVSSPDVKKTSKGVQGVQYSAAHQKKEPRKLGGLTQVAKQRAEARKQTYKAEEAYVSELFSKLEENLPSEATHLKRPSKVPPSAPMATRSLYQAEVSTTGMASQEYAFSPTKVNPHALQAGETLIRQRTRKTSRPEPLQTTAVVSQAESHARQQRAIDHVQAHLEATSQAHSHAQQQLQPAQRSLPRLTTSASNTPSVPEETSAQARAKRLRAKLKS